MAEYARYVLRAGIEDERHATEMSLIPTPAIEPPPRVRPSFSGPPRALVLLGVVLALYAAFGRGFAYAGVPPVFVGEVALIGLLFTSLGGATALPSAGPAALTAGLGGLVAVQAAVDLRVGAAPWAEIARGTAPFYYALYAFVTYALLRRYEERTAFPAVLGAIDHAVTRCVPWVLPVVTGLAALLLVEPTWLPAWPVSGVPMLVSKSTDISVALVVLAPFVRGRGILRRRGIHLVVVYGLWFVTALLVVSRSRGALLGLCVGLLFIQPRATRVVKGLLAATAVVLLLYVSGISVAVRGRELSYDAVGDAVGSIVGTQADDEIGSNYVGTATWRADWWADIWHDVTADRMVLHGHGWGDNLAVRYGIVPADAAREQTVLRLPHNVFFSLAGRGGLVAAVAFVLVPLLTVARTFTRATRRPPSPVVGAARGGVVASLVVGLVDVYLESPQGGILLWSLVGFLWWADAAHDVRPAGVTEAGEGRPT